MNLFLDIIEVILKDFFRTWKERLKLEMEQDIEQTNAYKDLENLQAKLRMVRTLVYLFD